MDRTIKFVNLAFGDSFNGKPQASVFCSHMWLKLADLDLQNVGTSCLTIDITFHQ